MTELNKQIKKLLKKLDQDTKLKLSSKNEDDELDYRNPSTHNRCDKYLLDKYVVVRTYSNGVWFGKLIEKDGNQVMLSEARMIRSWKCAQSVGLSGLIEFGINLEKSEINGLLSYPTWMEAIGILIAPDKFIEQVKSAPVVQQVN